MEKLPRAKMNFTPSPCPVMVIKGPRYPLALRSITSGGLLPSSNSVITFPSGLRGERDLIRAEALTHFGHQAH